MSRRPTTNEMEVVTKHLQSLPDRAAVRYLVELRDAEVWLAPIAGTRVLVPFRVEMPTPLGPGILLARQFVTLAQPTHAAAKTQ